MDKDYLTEKLNSLRNEMSHIWGGVFVIGGGAITILLTSSRSTLQVIFCIIGFLLAALFVNAYLAKRVNLVNTLNELKDGK